MKISIVIPFSGSTADLVPDLKIATDGAELIIVDNASDGTTRQAITEYLQPAHYIRNERNEGFAAANNQGYARATGDIIIFLNSDVAGNPAWLAAAAADIRDGALYGPSLQHQLVYGMWLPYIEGWCIGATRATWEQIRAQSVCDDEWRAYILDGPWDSKNFPGPYWEDNDLCLRAMLRGHNLVHTGWANFLQHKGGRTAGAIIKHGDTFERNRAMFAAHARAVWEAKMKAEGLAS